MNTQICDISQVCFILKLVPCSSIKPKVYITLILNPRSLTRMMRMMRRKRLTAASTNRATAHPGTKAVAVVGGWFMPVVFEGCAVVNMVELVVGFPTVLWMEVNVVWGAAVVVLLGAVVVVPSFGVVVMVSVVVPLEAVVMKPMGTAVLVLLETSVVILLVTALVVLLGAAEILVLSIGELVVVVLKGKEVVE